MRSVSVMFRWAGTSSCLLPSTGSVGTRFAGRIGITGLCGTCVQCLCGSSHFRKEKSSLQETSQQSFTESEQQVLRLTVFDCRTLRYEYTTGTGTGTEKQRLKYHEFTRTYAAASPVQRLRPALNQATLSHRLMLWKSWTKGIGFAGIKQNTWNWMDRLMKLAYKTD